MGKLFQEHCRNGLTTRFFPPERQTEPKHLPPKKKASGWGSYPKNEASTNPFCRIFVDRDKCLLFGLYAHARGHTEGGGYGGKHGDYDVEDFTPDAFVFFHS
jgi:hypothetical protein